MFWSWLWGAGRTGRVPYWIAVAVIWAISWAAHWVSGPLLGAGVSVLVLGPAVLLVQVVTSWLMVCLYSRRLHDFGQTGWWQVLPFLGAFCGLALAEPSWAEALGLSQGAATGAAWVALGIVCVFTVAIGLQPSSGPNRFDRPPLAA